MDDLNPRLVAYFVSVIEEGHFGRASEKLFISTPALSQQIKRLEKQLGVELIDRSAHPLQPTAAGRRFLPEARAFLATARRAVEAATSEVPPVRLGFMAASLVGQTRRFLELVRERQPRLEVALVELQWADLAGAVRSGEVDGSILRPPMSDRSGLRLDVLCDEARVAVLPVGHPLAGRDYVDLGDLDDEPHVRSDGADPEWVRWWACDPRPSGRPVVYGPSVRTMDEMLEVVASGAAIVITTRAVEATRPHEGVVFVPVRDAPRSTMCLCTRRDDLSAGTRALIDGAMEFRGNVL
ncbi:LysR family transcriptional regulator [Rhodococcus wratislaviensis]|uniref:LysR family transcriptional regulator n=2 Tax=Rhodococcus wratislaviensis TaxID=44752 RepID=A0AB38F6K1_RHOWR|nr:LysR family transcriptional regulator [Rhodococcus wratislaviensis]REE77524.1 LysR family transcriptional regulator [Rhodococcus wratislaviensis]GAF49400.1 putative LysR family transcriptional regulator [Rhodococcus wratislaviensis NBRC 100605]SPZ35337.1 LysR family transcriptional regulator [Rhodococcus wratislaviensis]